MNFRLALVSFLFFAGFSAAAEMPAPMEAVSLSELARSADLVALAQARDTDYRMQRDIPISGSAYLKILLPYKMDRAIDLVEVYETGLHDHECYFPNPTVFEEGRRYLLFLRRDPDEPERYRGMPQGCALEVLVRDDNRYAVRYPADGVLHSDDLAFMATNMSFADGYAVVSDEDLLPARRNALREAGQIVPHGKDAWRYTTGIDLATLRRHIGPQAPEN
jgi:hypothetical protein